MTQDIPKVNWTKLAQRLASLVPRVRTPQPGEEIDFAGLAVQMLDCMSKRQSLDALKLKTAPLLAEARRRVHLLSELNRVERSKAMSDPVVISLRNRSDKMAEIDAITQDVAAQLAVARARVTDLAMVMEQIDSAIKSNEQMKETLNAIRRMNEQSPGSVSGYRV